MNGFGNYVSCTGNGEPFKSNIDVGSEARTDSFSKLGLAVTDGVAPRLDYNAEECFGGDRESTKRRKLILHFDVRNTILVADSVTQVKVEQALNTFLTGVTWGNDTDGEWVWLSDFPSIGPPCTGAITYYKRLEKELARTPGDRAVLRQATGDFTQTDLGKIFRPYFEKHLEMLQWHHNEPDGLLTMVGRDNLRYHYLLPSFIRLMYELHGNKRDFAIVLRTYGMDASNVLSCLKYIFSGNHPDFPDILPITVRTQPGSISRSENGFIWMKEEEKDGDGKVIEDEFEIYEMLSSCQGISGFVDDFVHWQGNNYSHLAGKPFWIDLRDDHVHHIFFDDNIRVTADDSIVDVRVMNSDAKKVESITLEKMAFLKDACLVQSDLLEGIANVEYFVEKVKMCEKNYEELSESDFCI